MYLVDFYYILRCEFLCGVQVPDVGEVSEGFKSLQGSSVPITYKHTAELTVIILSEIVVLSLILIIWIMVGRVNEQLLQ